MSAGEVDRVGKQLDQSQAGMDRANRLVRQAAEQMIPDDPLCPHPHREAHPVPLQRRDAIA